MKKKVLITAIATAAFASAAMTACRTTAPAAAQTATAETTKAANTETSSAVGISNSYDNNEELLAKFPIENLTPVDSDMERNIQNRLLNGFENWNRGFDAWKAWGDILYTPDSLYNIHGAKLTLAEYQKAMDIELKATDIQMGVFHNMVICDDWTAIRYDTHNTNKKTGKTSDGTVMEFVHFKDYGDDLGTRVVEGWAGTKDKSFDGVSNFQTEEEKTKQQEALQEVVNYTIPETTELAAKYPVLNPTSIDDGMGKKIQAAILQDFDNWNQGAEVWSNWSDTYFTKDFQLHGRDEDMGLEGIKSFVKEEAEKTENKRLFFDNMLISGDWAAIHYRVTNTDKATNEKNAGDVMQFLHFVQEGDSVKVSECWTK
ncbi:nuclear transport factor 2 family protein [Lacrimispora sp. 38-1]|uniref:nuclear transport factor 2 family protein n=1 Tax=Lacrimispora sp. 38-1 TaxID=3125778 RepID=UPI003CF39227